MKSKSMGWALAAWLLGGLLIHGTPCAAQQIPATCSAKAARAQKYQLGLSKGLQKADELFASSEIGKNPQRLQRKLGRVLARLHDHVWEVALSDASEGRRCRVQGVADGFLGRVVQLLGQCVLDGAQWGQFAAQLYCELSLELGGLQGTGGVFVRAPAGLCGALFEATCDEVYAYTASEGADSLSPEVQRFAAEHGVTLAPYPGCAQYTTGDFASVFATSMQQDCAYAAP